jgi:NDP-sugar pyrophosphorylase family protein
VTLQCVILAGGLGTRMQQHNARVPKALLPVAGEPFAYWQLRWLARYDVDVVYSIGYKGELLREYVGDGARWGIAVTYVDEQTTLLGTGGAVRLAYDQGVLDDTFFVLYGDSFLQIDLDVIDRFYRTQDRPAVMTVYENRDQWDTSNAAFHDGVVTRYEKNAPQPDDELHYIDYGLSEISRELVGDHIPAGQTHDLSQLFTVLSKEGRLGGFEATKRFFEIGSPSGLADFDEFLRDGGDELPE